MRRASATRGDVMMELPHTFRQHYALGGRVPPALVKRIAPVVEVMLALLPTNRRRPVPHAGWNSWQGIAERADVRRYSGRMCITSLPH